APRRIECDSNNRKAGPGRAPQGWVASAARRRWVRALDVRAEFAAMPRSRSVPNTVRHNNRIAGSGLKVESRAAPAGNGVGATVRTPGVAQDRMRCGNLDSERMGRAADGVEPTSIAIA